MPKPGDGYGSAHRRERAKWKRIVDAGLAYCCLCGKPIPPGAPFHLDHTPDRTGYRGAACPYCNTADGGRRRHQKSRPPNRWVI